MINEEKVNKSEIDHIWERERDGRSIMFRITTFSDRRVEHLQVF